MQRSVSWVRSSPRRWSRSHGLVAGLVDRGNHAGVVDLLCCDPDQFGLEVDLNGVNSIEAGKL